jgi:hypothetical protein
MGMAYTGNPRTSERASTTRTRRYFGSQIITNFFFHRYVSRILSRELLKNKTNVIGKLVKLQQETVQDLLYKLGMKPHTYSITTWPR